MPRHLILIAMMSLLADAAVAADESRADKAISKAIADLEAVRDTLSDPLDKAKIDKAVRELEAVVGGEEDTTKPPALTFVVKPATLKKKFGGKATFNAKTGELSLAYDFSQKSQLADFEVNDLKIAMKDKVLLIDSADQLQHVAKFKNFAVSTILVIKVMHGAGVASSNGTLLKTGGVNPDYLWMTAAQGDSVGKVVPDNVRSGRIPITFAVTSTKASAAYGNERLAIPVVKKDDIHQIILVGGSEGCGFSNLVITGVPDPVWFKEFLDSE